MKGESWHITVALVLLLPSIQSRNIYIFALLSWWCVHLWIYTQKATLWSWFFFSASMWSQMIKFRLPGYYSKHFDQVSHLIGPKPEYVKGYRWWGSCRYYSGAQQSLFPEAQSSWTKDRHFVPITAHHRWLHFCTFHPYTAVASGHLSSAPSYLQVTERAPFPLFLWRQLLPADFCCTPHCLPDAHSGLSSCKMTRVKEVDNGEGFPQDLSILREIGTFCKIIFWLLMHYSING